LIKEYQKSKLGVFMKALALAMLFVSTSSFALDYTCTATKGRQWGEDLPTKGELKVEEVTVDGVRLINVNGSLAVDYDFNLTGDEEPCYQGTFTNVTLAEKANYRPNRYTGYSKFEDFDATETSRCDGGGMWGYLVIEKDTKKKPFNAHYIFQSGDHMGGTIDFECK
jgi:hypothetical protein